jgi:Mrp family chromosome partitioning ATPase
MSNKKVALVGLDLRKPKLHDMFENINNEIGITTYLINKSSIGDILFKTHIDNLYFIPSGPVPPNPAELIDSPQMEELVSHLKKEFDYIKNNGSWFKVLPNTPDTDGDYKLNITAGVATWVTV